MLETKIPKRLSYLRENIYSQARQNATIKKWRSIEQSLQRETSSLYKSLPDLGKKSRDRGILKRDLKPLLKSYTLRSRVSSDLKSRSSIDSYPLSRETMYQRRRESMKDTIERLGTLANTRQELVRRQTSGSSGLAEQLDVWDSDELRGNQGDLTARTLARSHHQKSSKGGRKVTFSMSLPPISHATTPSSSGALHGQAVPRAPRQVATTVGKSGETSSSSTTESTGRKIRLSLMVPIGAGPEPVSESPAILSDSEAGSIRSMRSSHRRRTLRSRSRSPFQRRRYSHPPAKPKFAILSKLVTVFLKSCRFHRERVEETFRTFEALDAILEPDAKATSDLLFNKSDYTSTKEAAFSSEARRILQKRPTKRSEKELHTLMLALRNYESIGEYPLKLQKAISERGWYETFDSKRVIIREGHLPAFFYVILSGSVMVAAFDPVKGLSRTVCFLGRGDTFGEFAIINKTPREITVISKSRLELLCLQCDDFLDIFITGAVGFTNEAFLREVPCFKGWPIKRLKGDTKNSIFGYFRRGTVLTKDGTNSEWLYIVKSGSCQVMKLLKYKDPLKMKHQVVADSQPAEAMLPDETHVQYLDRLIQLQLEDSQKKSKWFSKINMPTINIPTKMPETVLRHKGSSSLIKTDEDDLIREGSTLQAMRLLTKGPFLRASSSYSVSPDNNDNDAGSTFTRAGTKTPRFQSIAQQLLDKRKYPIKEEDEEHRFVTLEVLTRGSVFGLADMFSGVSQPCLSIVSNGAEVLMINRRFFHEHAPQKLVNHLRNNIYPYPNEKELERSLRMKLAWELTKKNIMSDYVRHRSLLRASVDDCRSRLQIK